MAHPAVDKFGQLIVRKLRDAAIEHFDRLARRGYNAPGLRQLQDDLAAMTPDQLSVARRAAISVIDHGVHDFLFALGELADFDDSIQVLVDGCDVARLSDGLHGEQFTDDGWIARFGLYSEDGEPAEPGK